MNARNADALKQDRQARSEHSTNMTGTHKCKEAHTILKKMQNTSNNPKENSA